MHMSRTERPAGVPPYKPASAVILAEFGKLLASLVLAYRECKTAIKQERTRARLFPGLFDNGAGVQKSPSTPHSSRKTAPPPPIYEEQNKSPLSASSLLPAGQINSAASSPMTRQSSSQSSWQSSSTDTKSKLSSSPSYSSLDGARDHEEDVHTYPSTPPRRGSVIKSGSSRSAASPEKQQRLLPNTPISDDNREGGGEGYDYAEKITEEEEENAEREEDQKITREEIFQRMKEDTFGHDWLKLSIPAFLIMLVQI
jgi:hypothetical protein